MKKLLLTLLIPAINSALPALSIQTPKGLALCRVFQQEDALKQVKPTTMLDSVQQEIDAIIAEIKQEFTLPDIDSALPDLGTTFMAWDIAQAKMAARLKAEGRNQEAEKIYSNDYTSQYEPIINVIKKDSNIDTMIIKYDPHLKHLAQATSKKNEAVIKVGPEWQKLPYEGQCFILLHEAAHIAKRHSDTIRTMQEVIDKNPELYHKLCRLHEKQADLIAANINLASTTGSIRWIVSDINSDIIESTATHPSHLERLKYLQQMHEIKRVQEPIGISRIGKLHALSLKEVITPCQTRYEQKMALYQKQKAAIERANWIKEIIDHPAFLMAETLLLLYGAKAIIMKGSL